MKVPDTVFKLSNIYIYIPLNIAFVSLFKYISIQSPIYIFPIPLSILPSANLAEFNNAAFYESYVIVLVLLAPIVLFLLFHPLPRNAQVRGRGC
jgi:hypothetical protein